MKRFTALPLVAAVTLASALWAAPMAQADDPNVVPDAALRGCIASTMDAWGVAPANAGGLTGSALTTWATSASGSITAVDVALLAASAPDITSSLDCTGVASVEGLQYLGGDDATYVLSGLNLTDGTITDISPLVNLYGMFGSVRDIDLSNNQISDLGPFQTLYDNITSSGHTPQVSSIDLSGNQITSLAPLGDYTSVIWLDVSDNPMDDGAFSEMVTLPLFENILFLTASNTDMTSLNWLSGVDDVQLVTLTAENNHIVDASGLAEPQLQNLSNLDLSGNSIDLATLAGADLPGLSYLDLSNNGLTGFAALADIDMPGLSYLDLSDNLISDASGLAAPGFDLDDLQDLYLQGNQISDVSSWAGVSLPSLYVLFLDDNQISDLSSWSGMDMPNLLELHLSGQTGGPVIGLDGLTGVPTLWYLYLDDDGIQDPSSLAAVDSLLAIGLSGNGISDASLLAGFVAIPDLGWLDLSNNNLSDASALLALTSLPNLSWIDLSYNQFDSVASVAGLLAWITPAWGSMTGDDWMTQWPDYCDDNVCLGVDLDGNFITDVSSLPPIFGFTEYNYYGVALRDQTATATVTTGDTISPVKIGTGDGPLTWIVNTGVGVSVNADGSITFDQAGTVTMTWHDASQYAAFDWDSYEITGISDDFTGTLTVTVSDPIVYTIGEASLVVDPVIGANTGGDARLADGSDAFNLVITVADDEDDPLPGATSQLGVDVPSEVTVSAITDNGDGTYSLTATSTTPGSYQAQLLVDGQASGDPCWLYFIDATVSQPTAQIGDTISADGLGFSLEEQVDVYLDSATTPIATIQVSQPGDPVHVTFTVPEGFQSGTHTFHFVGQWSGTASVQFGVGEPFVPGGGSLATNDGLTPGLALLVASLTLIGVVAKRRLA